MAPLSMYGWASPDLAAPSAALPGDLPGDADEGTAPLDRAALMLWTVTPSTSRSVMSPADAERRTPGERLAARIALENCKIA